MTISVSICRILVLISIESFSSGCTIHLGGDTGDVANEFTDSLRPSTPSDMRLGPMPEGSDLGPQIARLPSSGAPPTFAPGDSVALMLPHTGGADVVGVNIGFGGDSYFRVPATPGGGAVSFNATISPDVCNNLGDICHQIQCYEQVVTSTGTFSKAEAMQLVLNCTGGVDCDGNRTYCCTSTGTCGFAAPMPTPITCGDGRTYAFDTCVTTDGSAGYYDVSGRQFTFTPTDSTSIQSAANAATAYGTSLCSGG